MKSTQFRDIAARFPTLPWAVLGHGPEHPTDPRPELGAVIDCFLAAYPFLGRYPDSVLFLTTFAGASAAGALKEGPDMGDAGWPGQASCPGHPGGSDL
jgi:hypothetical protein